MKASQIICQILSRLPMPRFVLSSIPRIWMGMVKERDPRVALSLLLEAEREIDYVISYVAIRYNHGIHPKHRLMAYHDFFVDRLRADETVLDIGCGYGAVAYSMANRAGAKVVGMDISTDNIAKASALWSHPNLSFIVGDATKQVPLKACETVVISNVLEHIEHRMEFLRSVQSAIRPRRWLIRVPCFDRDWKVPMRKELGLNYYGDPTHFTEYTEITFREEMSAVGMVISELTIRWGEIWAVGAFSQSPHD